ncbi:MAG: hypothetical protein A2086_17265 [Spirochaetes bacterium GWD1_27_9]|nr:MAG: hypothetical protein A2Z98_12430 [Spirochaetes bacterium GWB1_27_13]OHD42471.1 MAG: hypothetical protein A2086_17265 [Spirochaetes bacterium GWD1_27_9]
MDPNRTKEVIPQGNKEKYAEDKTGTKKRKKVIRSTAVEFLKWVYEEYKLTPQVEDEMKQKFMDETGKNLPREYSYSCDGICLDVPTGKEDERR